MDLGKMTIPLSESHSTMFTLVGFLSSVNFKMTGKTARIRQSFIANSTRFFWFAISIRIKTLRNRIPVLNLNFWSSPSNSRTS